MKENKTEAVLRMETGVYLTLEFSLNYTRMHSRRMRTARLLPYLPACTAPGGVPSPGVYLVPGGVPGPRGCTWSQGVCLVLGGVPGPRGCTCPGTPPTPLYTESQTPVKI